MSLPANMAAQAATGSTTWCRCIKIHSVDGLILGWTDHDRQLSIDIGDGDGSIDYEPIDAIEVTSGRIAADLAVDNIEIMGAVDDDRLTAEDIHAGRYEETIATKFECDWSDPAAGQKITFTGPMGFVETKQNMFVFEVRSQSGVLGRKISQTIGPACRKSFGSTTATERPPNLGCGVALTTSSWAALTAYVVTAAGDRQIGDRVRPSTPNGWWYRCTVAGTSAGSEPTWPVIEGGTVVDGTVTWTAERALSFTGTVSGVTSRRSWLSTGVDIEAEFFARGAVNWLTGENAAVGMRFYVAADDGAGALVCYRNAARDIEIGDTFEVTVGCDRSKARCIDFDNYLNHNGLPNVPTRVV